MRYHFILLNISTLLYLTAGYPGTAKKCGISKFSEERIVGGNPAKHGDLPWMVTIHHYYRNLQHLCGGAILNEHWIVTAAHCIDHPDKPSSYEVFVGLHNLSDALTSSSIKISKVIVHEDFDRTWYKNDIALLRTTDPIEFEGLKRFANGICLPITHEDPTGSAFVAGWGYTKEGGMNSNTLNVVEIPLISRHKCDKAYGGVMLVQTDENSTDKIISSTKICAGQRNKDACQNDSGGPLFQKNSKGVHTLIGIVSHGRGCGSDKYPGVYTKVAAYTQWLEKNMD